MSLVERILSAKRLPVPPRQTGAAPDADTTALGREIDARFYRRCLPAPRLRQAGGLTADAIKLVESAR